MTDAGADLVAALGARDEAGARRAAARLTAADTERGGGVDRLALRAAGGDPLALELLVEVVDGLGLARRAVRTVLVDEAAVDDVAQDTLIALSASIASFRGDAKLTTWLHSIARNRAVDHLRRQRATEQLDEHDVGDAQRLSSVIASRETANQLVGQLPAHYRDAVMLRDVERLSYAEAADRLERNVNTIKSHVARGRALLARMLEDEGAP